MFNHPNKSAVFFTLGGMRSLDVHKIAMTFTLGTLLFLTVLSTPVLPGCYQRRVVQTVRYGDCLPKRLLTYACVGTCESFSKTSPGTPGTLETSCNCCSAVAVAQRRTSLDCPDPTGETTFTPVIHKVLMPLRCACWPCGQSSYAEVFSSLGNSTDSDSSRQAADGNTDGEQ
ncbi:hypothetical protein ScPMuIL_001307 [Solemya velum]